MLAKKYIAVIAAVAIVAVACVSYIAFSNDGNNDPVFNMGINSEGNDKSLLINSSGEYFKQDIGTSDILVYYIVLDSYLNEYNEFDSAKFVDDMDKEGAYDEDLQEYIPSFTQKITDFKVTFIDSKDIVIDFTASGSYASYVVYLNGSGLIGIDSIVVSEFDLPDPEFVDNTPYVSIVSDIYENVWDMDIVLKLENTTFSADVSEEDITLKGAFENLEVSGVKLLDADRLQIETEGCMQRAASYVGYIELSADATVYGKTLVATEYMDSSYIWLDLSSFQIVDGFFIFDMIQSEGVADRCESIVIDGTPYSLDTAEKTETGESILRIAMPMPYEDVGSCVGALNGLNAAAVGMDGGLIYDFIIAVPETVVYADTESYKVKSDGGLEVTVALTTLAGSIGSLKAEDIELRCNYIGAKFDVKDNIFILTVPDFNGTVFNASLVIKNGVMTPWGTDAGEYTVGVVCTVEHDADALGATTKQMVKELYKAMQFSKVFTGIQIAAIGIEGVISILGALHIIDTRSATDIMIEDIRTNTEQIKQMLADQAEILNSMNKKLTDILDALKEAELRDYSTYYNNLMAKSNSLANSIRVYSEELKGDVWDMIVGKYDGKTLHIYFAVDGSITVMQNSIFERTDAGQSIDGKSILPKYTVEIDIVKDKTFADARIGTCYSDKTEAKMIECLTTAFKEKYGETYTIVKNDGTSKTFTAQEVAKGICNGITTKFAQDLAKSDTGKKVLENYMVYTETLANLMVQPDGSIGFTMDMRNNPVLAEQKIIKSNYNFESEARKCLEAMDDTMVLFLYNYTIAANEIQNLQGTGSSAVQKHYDKAMEFLGKNRGYRVDVTKETKGYVEYCYVSNSFIKGKTISLCTEVVYESGNGFKSNIKSPPAVRCGLQTADDLRIPNSYVDTEQLAKILSNYNRLKASKEVTVDFYEYIRSAMGTEVTYRLIMTKFEGGEYYPDSREVKLYSAINLVNPGHSNILVKSGKVYTIKGTIDKSGPFGGMYKAYSKDVYTKVAYKGNMFDIKDLRSVRVSSTTGNLVYAVGYYCDHVGAWSNDETAVLTPQLDLDTDFEHHNIYDSNHEWCRVMVDCFMIETTGSP